MPGLKDDLHASLIRLNQSAPEIRASAFVSLDGLMLASALPPGTNEDAIAAMSATVLALGERTTREFAVGVLDQVYFKGAEGYILLQGAGDDGVLVVVTDGTAKLGVLFLLIHRTAGEIRQMVRQAITPKAPPTPQPQQPTPQTRPPTAPGTTQHTVPWGS
ncbi:roadblock/LC7 domain-containing protein [candidate division WOR-3 bacterium]|nr:roadblock/LC7 domain-containing protein [candidate division WOR-3 bacterium]